jgi:hypothetical protein
LNYEGASLDEVKELVKGCLIALYDTNDGDGRLFEIHSKGIAERCLVFRFAYYLQSCISDFVVDCDYNSSFVIYTDPVTRERSAIRTDGKLITNREGIDIKRFVDIVVHRRNDNPNDDFLCFETKKWNNYPKSDWDKDFSNLEQLTKRRRRTFQYKYGFFILFGRTLATTRWKIFKRGRSIPPGLEYCFRL